MCNLPHESLVNTAAGVQCLEWWCEQNRRNVASDLSNPEVGISAVEECKTACTESSDCKSLHWYYSNCYLSNKNWLNTDTRYYLDFNSYYCEIGK